MADEISRVVFAFRSGDSRREDVRRLADRVESMALRLAALEKVAEAARAVVRWSWPEMPQQWRDDVEALRVALGERKDGAE